MLCTFLTYKRELRVLYYSQKGQNLFKRWLLLLEGKPTKQKTFLMVSWLDHNFRLRQGRIFALTLRKECKCWFLPGDLIPSLLSGFELCSAQKLWEWHKPGFQPDLGFLELGWLAGTAAALVLLVEGVLTLVASFLLSFCKVCWSTRGYSNNIQQACLTLKKPHQDTKPA